MKTSLLTASAALGLTPLRWNAFSQAATGSYAGLTASFTPNKVQVLAETDASSYGTWLYRFSVNAGNIPGWVFPGAAVKIAAAVTVTAKIYDISSEYIVFAIDTTAGAYFDVCAARPHGGRDAAAITQAVAATTLEASSPTPLVTLIMQCQKAMFRASAGTVLLAPTVDFAGVADDPITISTTTGEYEVTAPNGAKFDLKDWSIKQSGSGTLVTRFI